MSVANIVIVLNRGLFNIQVLSSIFLPFGLNHHKIPFLQCNVTYSYYLFLLSFSVDNYHI